VSSSARDVEDAGVQLIDDRSEPPFTEQLDPLAGGIEDREGRLEEVVEADTPGGRARGSRTRARDRSTTAPAAEESAA
jgi:hypothetical protein